MGSGKISAADVDTLARTMWGEARGCGAEEMQRIGSVIMNRFRSKTRWWKEQRGDGIPDDTIQATCRDPYQFSCWNEKDPNRRKLEAVTVENAQFKTASLIAAELVSGSIDTGDALWYHTVNTHPKWASLGEERGEMEPCMSSDWHVFYHKPSGAKNA